MDESDEEDKRISYYENEVKVACPIDANRYVYKSIWINENNENEEGSRCDVCLGDDDNEGDEIVYCDGCNVAVH